MNSIRSKIIIGLIRHRHLFKAKLTRERVDEFFDYREFRETTEKVSKRMQLNRGVDGRKDMIRDIGGEWLIPEDASGNRALLYIHGGGFVSGSCMTHRAHASKIAAACGLKTFLFDYRLAPEHPFPAAVDDCERVYLGLIDEGFRPEDIILGGESAGGTLVLSLIQRLKRHRRPLPASAFAISPLTDFSCRAASFTTNAGKDIATLNSWNIWGKWYRSDARVDDPELSPLYGDYRDICPLYLCVGSHEVHLDDAKNLAGKAREQKADVTIKVWPGMVHAFPILAPLFPEATRALEEIGRFVKKSFKE